MGTYIQMQELAESFELYFCFLFSILYTTQVTIFIPTTLNSQKITEPQLSLVLSHAKPTRFEYIDRNVKSWTSCSHNGAESNNLKIANVVFNLYFMNYNQILISSNLCLTQGWDEVNQVSKGPRLHPMSSKKKKKSNSSHLPAYSLLALLPLGSFPSPNQLPA